MEWWSIGFAAFLALSVQYAARLLLKVLVQKCLLLVERVGLAGRGGHPRPSCAVATA